MNSREELIDEKNFSKAAAGDRVAQLLSHRRLVHTVALKLVRLPRPLSARFALLQVKEIAGYRSWTKVNAEPQLMPEPTAQLCADVRAIQRKSPHDNKFLTVYVNELGRKAMLEEVAPSFPEGSVIVKEKLPAKDSDQPELMTVMIKQAKGFNPANGDWEYMVVDGTGTTVRARGNLENCQTCHQAKPRTDYVFRTYLSAEATKKLK